MARTSAKFKIQELPGSEYPSLDAARSAALDDLSLHLVNTIRDLVASGRLVLVDGKIIPNPNR